MLYQLRPPFPPPYFGRRIADSYRKHNQSFWFPSLDCQLHEFNAQLISYPMIELTSPTTNTQVLGRINHGFLKWPRLNAFNSHYLLINKAFILFFYQRRLKHRIIIPVRSWIRIVVDANSSKREHFTTSSAKQRRMWKCI